MAAYIVLDVVVTTDELNVTKKSFIKTPKMRALAKVSIGLNVNKIAFDGTSILNLRLSLEYVSN